MGAPGLDGASTWSLKLEPVQNQWSPEELADFNALKDSVRAIIFSVLRSNKITILTCDARIKTLKSIEDKIKRKGYTDPKNQITDICGIRIICFLNSDVQKNS